MVVRDGKVSEAGFVAGLSPIPAIPKPGFLASQERAQGETRVLEIA